MYVCMYVRTYIYIYVCILVSRVCDELLLSVNYLGLLPAC